VSPLLGERFGGSAVTASRWVHILFHASSGLQNFDTPGLVLLTRKYRWLL
jgi:hypothetical protein